MASEATDLLLKQRAKELKGGLDADAGRTRREQNQIKIRKQKRDEQRAKRRQITAAAPPAVPGSSANPPSLEDQQKAQQALALQRMAEDPQTVRRLLANMSSQDDNLRLSATSQIRKLLSIEVNPPIQDVIDIGMVPILVQFLSRSDAPRLQFEAAWALTNIGSGSSSQTNAVLEARAVPPLINLIMSPHHDVREQSIWALGNIAGDGPVFRNMVLDAGIIPPLVSVMTPQSRRSLLRNATWTISNLCRGKPAAPFEVVKHCVPVLAQMIHLDDAEVLTDACWALSYLSDGSSERVQAVVSAGCVKRLVELMTREELSVKTPALRTIGNIVTGDDGQTQAVLNSGAVPILNTLLRSNRRSLRKEAAWALSNITAGNADQVAHVVQQGAMSIVAQLMLHDEFEIRKECVWCVCNATHGGRHDAIMTIAAAGVIEGLVKLLSVPDARVVIVSMEALENILAVGEALAEEQGSDNPYIDSVDAVDGETALQMLQHHADTGIFMKAKDMLIRFFDAEDGDDEEEAAGPALGENGMYQFGAQNNLNSQPLQFNGLGNLGNMLQ